MVVAETSTRRSAPRRRRATLGAMAITAVGALLAAGSAASANAAVAKQSASTVGSYSASYGFDGHAGLYAYGMGFDATDNTVLVGDLWNYRVKRYDESGKFLKVVSHIAARGATGGIGAPFGVAADTSGNVWVADQSNSRIVEFDHNGNWLQTIGSGGGPNPGEKYPVGCGNGKTTIPTHLVIDPTNGDVYVTDPRCRAVYVYNKTGTFLRQFTWNIKGTPIPRGIGMDTAGNVYVAEFNHQLIYVFSKAGTQLRVFNPPSPKPTDMADVRGIAVDNVPGHNRVYAIGAQNNDVVVYNTNGTYVTTWRSAGATAFSSIRFVTTDNVGNVYVSDLYGYIVWKFDMSGSLLSWSTPAAPPPNGGWNQVNGVAIDPATGNLFGVDTFGNRVQRFGTTGGQSCPSASSCAAFQLAFGQRGPLAPGSPNLDYPHEPAVGTSNDPFHGNDLWMDGENVLLHFDLDGNYIGSLGVHGRGLSAFKMGPQGIQVAPFGSTAAAIYTVDAGNCRIQIFDYAGNLLAHMGSCGKGTDQMSAPRQLAVDAANHHVYVADTGNSRVVEWDTTTGHIIATVSASVVGKHIAGPDGVALDPTGTWVYIGDTANQRVVRVHADLSASSGVLVTTGSDDPQHGFKGPGWMTFSPVDGRLFFSDNNQVIYAYTITG